MLFINKFYIKVYASNYFNRFSFLFSVFIEKKIIDENQYILEEEMKKQCIVFKKIGNTIREKLIFINDKYKFDLNNLIELNNRWFKNYSKN